MSNFSFSLLLKANSDSRSSNAPSLSNFSWARSANGISVEDPQCQAFQLAPGETRILFSGLRTLAQDGTTQYTLSLVAGSTNLYQLTNTGGTPPNFRIPRTTGADSTTTATVTLNGPLATFSSTSGTPFSLISGGVTVGDYVAIGTNFNVGNQGTFQILSFTNTSFTVANEVAVAEGPIALGSGFATQVQIFSAAGVQIGDTLAITSGFSSVTWGDYQISSVAAESVQFYSNSILPVEGPITTEVAIYFMAKRLVYLESDQPVEIDINGIAMQSPSLTPFVVPQCPNTAFLNPNGVGTSKPGMFLLTTTAWSMSVTNLSQQVANLTLISVQ